MSLKRRHTFSLLNENRSNVIDEYNELKVRESVAGTRRSTRVRRLPTTMISAEDFEHSKKIKIEKVKCEPLAKNVIDSILNNDQREEELDQINGILVYNGAKRVNHKNVIVDFVPSVIDEPGFGHITIPPGVISKSKSKFKEHFHLLCGKIQLLSGNKSKMLSTGSVTTIPKGTTYVFRNDEKEPAVMFFMMENMHPKNEMDSYKDLLRPFPQQKL